MERDLIHRNIENKKAGWQEVNLANRLFAPLSLCHPCRHSEAPQERLHGQHHRSVCAAVRHRYYYPRRIPSGILRIASDLLPISCSEYKFVVQDSVYAAIYHKCPRRECRDVRIIGAAVSGDVVRVLSCHILGKGDAGYWAHEGHRPIHLPFIPPHRHEPKCAFLASHRRCRSAGWRKAQRQDLCWCADLFVLPVGRGDDQCRHKQGQQPCYESKHTKPPLFLCCTIAAALLAQV